MTHSASEKWLVALLNSAPNRQMPARDIIAAGVAAGIGSAATLQRAGVAVATKSRRKDGVSVWTLTAPQPAQTEQASDPVDRSDFAVFGGYGLWHLQALESEAQRRGFDLWPADRTHSEMCALLVLHDDGVLSPHDVARSLRSGPLPY